MSDAVGAASRIIDGCLQNKLCASTYIEQTRAMLSDTFFLHASSGFRILGFNQGFEWAKRGLMTWCCWNFECQLSTQRFS